MHISPNNVKDLPFTVAVEVEVSLSDIFFLITTNKMQLFLFIISKRLYMFWAVPAPIIRST